jgi:hypothetical protein
VTPTLGRCPGWSLSCYHDDLLHFLWQGAARDLGGALSRDLLELEQVPLAVQFEELSLYASRGDLCLLLLRAQCEVLDSALHSAFIAFWPLRLWHGAWAHTANLARPLDKISHP